MLTEQIKIIKLQKQAVLQLTAFWHMMNVLTDYIEPMLVLFRSIQKSLQHNDIQKDHAFRQHLDFTNSTGVISVSKQITTF